MLTRVILAAGVAALAISAPASGGPRDGDKQRGAQRAERQQVRAERPARAERQQVRVERQARAERPARAERQMARAERPARAERQQVRVERQARVERANRIERQARVDRANRIERQQVRAERQARVERAPRAERVRIERADNRIARRDVQSQRQQLRAERQMRGQELQAQRQELRAERQFRNQELKADRQDMRAIRIANADTFRASRLAALSVSPRTRILAPAVATSLVGLPLVNAANTVQLVPLPQTVRYLYPDTDDYYYRYGDGYLYRVDRDNDLISWVLPLLAGGLMPGSYLPASYMNSYVPNYYGFNSFYPNSPYDCYRYGEGVVFEIDCATGLIEDVIPLYAGGYGVGQMLPSSYSYYNVPSQYRSLYYDNDDYGYWYAPGAIYQYDRDTSLITSLAALLSPGLSIGQPLPMGYSAYNVPYDYRQTYYDTPTAMYRYNNGNIYQIDPTTLLVTAIVASILT